MKFKTPIYYHIPKCGGTYVLSSIWRFLSLRQHVKQLIVCDKDQTIARILVEDSTGHESNIFVAKGKPTISINYLKSIANEISYIHVVPTGIRYIDALYNEVDLELHAFTTMRHPIQRIISLFNYLNSTSSSHESSHGKIGHIFDEYLLSQQFEKNWMTNNFGCNGDRQYDKALSVLNMAKVYGIHQIVDSIEDIKADCFPTINATKDSEIMIDYNATPKKLIKYNQLNAKTINRLITMLSSDIRLYHQFI